MTVCQVSHFNDRIACNQSRFTLTAAIYVTAYSAVLDVDCRTAGIICQVTAAIDVTYIPAARLVVLFYINLYGAVNGTAGVVTAKYLLERTVGNITVTSLLILASRAPPYM